MDSPHIIYKYFPDLTERQKEQFEKLGALYGEWNAKINVISRRDIDNLYTHHVLHSLGIAKYISFKAGTQLLDVGTGGGFPGIPLAILFPECTFRLIDSIGKKVRVADAVATSLGLENVETAHRNAVEERGKYHYVISRAVMNAPELVKLISKNIAPRSAGNALPPGLICLKGGELAAELQPFARRSEVCELSQYFAEPFFETKKVVYVQL